MVNVFSEIFEYNLVYAQGTNKITNEKTLRQFELKKKGKFNHRYFTFGARRCVSWTVSAVLFYNRLLRLALVTSLNLLLFKI